MSYEPIVSEAAEHPRKFEDKDWDDALTASKSGLKRTTLMQALLGLVMNQELEGGSMKGCMAVPVGNDTYRNARVKDELFTQPDPSIQTMGDIWRDTCEKHAQNNCMGWRDILSMTKDGNKEKYVLGGYNWITYRQAQRRARNFGAGLAALGVKKGEMVNFFADTKAEWQLGCQGCLERGIVVATSYANLGPEAVAYGLKQTKCSVVFTDADLIPTLNKVLGDCPDVKHVVFSRDKRPANHPAHNSDEKVRDMITHSGIQAHSFEEVEQLGEGATKEDLPSVNPDDTGVIMYTSGSTGNPKGVIISHRNLVAGIAGCADAICGMSTDDVYLAYLPLAHILELIAESSLYFRGVAVGYGSTKTITDASVCIEAGKCVGDANELRPTLMAAVPMIMDKIRAGVMNKINSTGGITKQLFELGFSRKKAALAEGNESPFWNKILFDNIRARLLGGRVRYMLSGGGPLSKETQDFMNVVFCCPVGQGWGLTESVGVATICWPNDRTAGRVGAPICSMQIKLEDWEEGGYYADPARAPEDNKHPHPRGELLLGGPQITMGYFEEPEKTEEAYFTDENGTRWLRTGDIGEVYPDGAFAIVDRKKDLVKLSGGEYVSFGKLEPMIRDSDHVDNAMVYCDSEKSYSVAVIQVAPESKDVDDERIHKDVTSILKRAGCAKFEIPQKIYVERDLVWGPGNDLCTAALKLKRRNLVNHYDKELKELYNES